MTTATAPDSVARLCLVDDDVSWLEDIKASQHWEQYESASHVVISTLTDVTELRQTIGSLADRAPELPNVIVLDLMIGRDRNAGIKILRWLKKHKNRTVRSIPVIIFSTSDDPEDIESAYRRGANSYVTKGHDGIHKFWQIVQYWTQEAVLPHPTSKKRLG